MLSLDGRLLPSAGGAAPSLPPVVLVHGFAVTATQCWDRTGWVRRLGRTRDLVLVALPWHRDPELKPQVSVPLGDESSHDELPPAGPALPQNGSASGLENATPPSGGTPSALDVSDVLDALAELLSAVCSRTGHEAVDLVGYSLGARLCWDLAAEEPDRIRRLVLGGLPGTDRLGELVDALAGPGAAAIGPDALPPQAGPSRPATVTDPGLAEVLELVRASTLPEADLLACAHALSRPRFAPAPVHGPPALLVRGGDDAVAGPPEPLAVLRRPAGEVLELPGRTHVDALTSGAFVRAAADFLAAKS